MTKQEMLKFDLTYTRQSGAAQLARIADQLRAVAEEVDRYGKRYAEEESPADAARQLNWALGYVSTNTFSNLRLDMLADTQAKLVQLVALLKDA